MEASAEMSGKENLSLQSTSHESMRPDAWLTAAAAQNRPRSVAMQQPSTHSIPSPRPPLPRFEVLESGLGIRPSPQDHIHSRMQTYTVTDRSKQNRPDLDGPFLQARVQKQHRRHPGCSSTLSPH